MQIKKIVRTVLLLLLLILLVFTVLKIINREDNNDYPLQLPAFSFTTLQGESLVLDTVSCEHSIVVFYSPGCAFCEHEGQELSRNSHAFDNCKLFFITMEPIDSAKSYTERHELLAVSNYYSLVDTTRMAPLVFNIRTIPTTFIYDRNKKLIHSFTGEVNAKKLLTLLNNGE